MKYFDFDKSFSEDFRKNRMETPSPEKWLRMEASLRQMKEQKRRKRGIFFLLFPYLLLAGMTGAFVWQWQTSQQLMAGLQGQVTDLEKRLEACGQQPVTIFPARPKKEASKTIGVNPINVQEPRQRRLSFQETTYEANLGSTEQWQPTVFKGAQPIVTEPEKAVELVVQEPILADEKPLAEAAPTPDLEQTITAQATTPKQRTNRSPLPAQDYAPLSSTENNSVEIDAAVKPVFVKEPKEPKGFVVGLTGTHLLPKYKIAIEQQYNSTGKAVGLTVQYRFKKGWCVQAGYDYGRLLTRYDLAYDTTYNPLLPPPPAAGYYMKNSTYRQFQSTFYLGIRRYFFLKKRLQPSLALNWVGEYWHNGQSETKWVNTDDTKPAIKTSNSSKISMRYLRTYQVSGALSYRALSRVELMAQVGWQLYPKSDYVYSVISAQLGVLGYF